MATKFKYNGNTFSWLDAVRQAIWENEQIAFGDFNDAMMQKFGVEKTEYNPEDEMTDEQLAERRRCERDAKLRATDKYLLPDFPGITPESLENIKMYREALRNVPEQAGFPRQIIWPEVPVFTKAKEKGGA